MWKLSKLEIRGFKSFADAAELDFPEGITAVVGPNGCGKSNISDAILWVLGEQSTRALRAQRMQDVIFQGTATRRAIGLAEVTLFLTNGTPIDEGGFDPLADFESVLGVAVPEDDEKPATIDDLAAAAGIGGNGSNGEAGNGHKGNGHNGNGANGKGANGNGTGSVGDESAAAEDAVVAEGIAIDTSGSIEIEATDEPPVLDDPLGVDEDANLLKITRRLFRSGDSEYLLNGKSCRLRDIRERLAGTGLGSRACFLIGQGKIDQILSASSIDRRAPLEEAAGITLYRQRRHLTQLKLEAAAQDLARIDDIYDEVGRHMRSLKRQAGKARRYKKLRKQIRHLERAWLHGELSESRQRQSLLAAAVNAAKEVQATAREMFETASGQLDEARKRLRASRLAEQERRQRVYQNQLEQERLKAEAQRQEDRSTFAKERLAELERRSDTFEERLAEAVGLQKRREEVALQSATAAEAAKLVLVEAEEELEAARRRLELTMRPANKSPVEDGEPRRLSSDLVVEEGDFPAISLAIGDLLDVKVMPDKRLGEWLGETLDGNRRMRALRRTEPGFESPPPADHRIVGALRDRVKGRNETASAVVHSLLHDTWLVNQAEDAPALAHEHPGHAFVDRTGSCWACGVEVRVRGRQARLATPVLKEEPSAKAKPEAARERLEVTSPEELAAREKRDRAATASRAASAQAEAARQELGVSEAAGRRLESDRKRTLAEIETLKDASEKASSAAVEARRQADAVSEKGVELEADLEAVDTDDKTGEAEVAGLDATQSQARAEVERAQEVRSKLDIEAAELRVSGRHIEQQIHERLSMEPDFLLQQGPVKPVPVAKPEEGEADGAAGEAPGEEGEAPGGVSEAQSAAGETQPDGAGDARVTDTEAAEDGAANATTAAPVEPTKPEKDDLVDVLALDTGQLRAMIVEVQAKLDRLGPVNLVAYEDFQVEEERHGELGSQRSDLKGAAANLDEAIRRIDEDCIKRFSDCFESINGYFNRIFRQLFGGGKAGMRLEEPDDPLNTGIEIFAQPPGKKLQNVRLLSGGERTLVALSLLFAIFEYRPTAFCILDEADAALDEVNVDRFLRALHSFESRTQFILITHNKRTMEIADLLYGVTMQESGVSQLVSVQMH